MVHKAYDNILIGGSGFIGSALARALSQRGESVLSISRNASDVLPLGVEEWVTDISETSLPAFPAAKTVFILIGQNSSDFDIHQELESLKKLVESCNRIQPEKVFYLSSVLAYGERQKPAWESDELIPVDSYSEYKAKAENLLKSHVAPESHLGILRLANVYGGPKNRGFIGFLMKHVLGVVNEKIRVNGDGSQERDYIFLDDVVGALLAVKDGLKTSDTVNIASGQSHTLLDLITCVEKVAKKALPYEKGGQGGIEVNCSRISNNKLREQYAFTPAYSLTQGLEKTLERYKRKKEEGIAKKKVLLLGGEGFIGRNISAHLYPRYECFSLGETMSLFPHRQATFIQANPYQEKTVGEYDTIIHLIDHKIPLEQFLEEEKKLIMNVPLTTGTHLILFSSAVVYANPHSEYGKRKRALEELYMNYCRRQGISLTIFRAFNIFGPFQIPYRQGSLVANLIHNSLVGRKTEINDMEAKRDFVYVGDVARSVERAILSRPSGIFDIGSGHLTSIRELIASLEDILTQKINFFDRGLSENLIHQPIANHSWDLENMVDLGEGLAQTVPFYRLYGPLIEEQRENF